MSDMSDAIGSRFDLTELPVDLQANMSRHGRHLAELMESLRSAGLNEGMIADGVRDLVDTYHAELLAAFQSLLKATTDD